MKKFVNGMITGAVMSAGAVTAMNMMSNSTKKQNSVGTALHKLGDMADNIKK